MSGLCHAAGVQLDAGPPTPLRGDEVVLRALVEEDLPALIVAVTDHASRWGTSVPSPYTARDAERFLESVRHGWAENTCWTFALARADLPEAYAGGIDLRYLGTGRAEIGFLTHPAARGRGLTADAVRTILRWGFGPMRLHSVEWRARVGNVASLRIAWKCGFSYDGLIRDGMHQRGVRHDCHVGTVLAGEPLEPREPWEAWAAPETRTPQR